MIKFMKNYLTKIVFIFLFLIINTNSFANILTITTPAKQVVIYDHEINKILFEKNANDIMKPASMAKVMTAYIVFDRLQEGTIKFEDRFLVSEKAWKKGGSRTFLELNSQVSVEDLLRGLIVQSGNDAAIALAEGISGSEEDFAREMNQYAKMLDMNSTFFTNSTGWPHPDLKTTANDLIKLTDGIILNFPDLYKLFYEKEYTYNQIRQSNRNPFLVGRHLVNGADGLKTGHTHESGYGLIGSVKRNNRRISIVVNGLSGKKQRAIESKRLIEIAFRETYLLRLFEEQQTLANANVWLGKENTIELVAEKPLKILINRPMIRKTNVQLIWDDPVQAPINKLQKVGKIIIKIPGQTDIFTNLVSRNNVDELGPFSRLKSAFNFLLFGGDYSN